MNVIGSMNRVLQGTPSAVPGRRKRSLSRVRGWAKWGACGLVMLLPGSFVILPLLWLSRRWSARERSRAIP